MAASKVVGSSPSTVGARLVVFVFLAVASLGTARADEPVFVGKLRPGDSIHWTGPFVREARVFWELCDVMGPCYNYAFSVSRGTDRLRVAFDPSSSGDTWGVAVSSPDKRRLPLVFDPVSDRGGGVDGVTREHFFERPAVGIWEVTVVPIDVTAASFRMRAKLERAPVRSPGRRLLAPNLRAHPPFEPTFSAPVRQFRAPYYAGPIFVPGGTQAPMEAAGFTPFSCTFDEMLQKGAVRCLRLSVGFENVGAGPLELRFSPVGEGPPTMRQRLHFNDGSTSDRPAGTYEFHTTHLHYHAADFAVLRLFRVADPQKGILTATGRGHKRNFCLGDLRIVDFRSFEQDREGSIPSDCSSPRGASMALTRGWMDIYPWHLQDNYVEFGNNPDGYYVVRVTADPFGRLTETDDTDNVAYMYARVTGSRVDVLERGYGTDPWDSDKQVLKRGG